MRVTKEYLQARVDHLQHENRELLREKVRLVKENGDLKSHGIWFRQLIQQQSETLLAGAKEGSFPRR